MSRRRLGLFLALLAFLAAAYRFRVLPGRADVLLDYFLYMSASTTFTPLPVIPAIVHAATLAPVFLVALVGALGTTVAYLIALIVAIFLALAITANRRAEDWLLPVFDVLQSFPSFALFPVLVAALRNRPETVIISVLVITIIWPILFTIIGAIKNRREDLEEAATIFGAVGWRRLTNFTLPVLMPAIVTGSIVGWGEGWEFIIGAELLVRVQTGIGVYLGLLGDAQQTGLLALGILILMLFLYLINRSLWLPLLHQTTQYESEA